MAEFDTPGIWHGRTLCYSSSYFFIFVQPLTLFAPPEQAVVDTEGGGPAAFTRPFGIKVVGAVVSLDARIVGLVARIVGLVVDILFPSA